MANAVRIHPLEDRLFAGNGVILAPEENLERISLRADSNAVAGLNKSLGLELPTKPSSVVSKSAKSALWIGPDEWLLIGPNNGSLMKSFQKVDRQVFSAVDISHRNTAIKVSGAKAVHALNSGCPRDLSLDAFPVKSCSRTILGKAEIILWRTGKQEFHVECWRSFSDYVWKFLVDAARSA